MFLLLKVRRILPETECYCGTHSHSAVSDKDRPILMYFNRAHFRGGEGEIISDIVSQPPERQPTATPNAHAKIHPKGTPFFTQILIVWQNSILVAVHIFL